MSELAGPGSPVTLALAAEGRVRDLQAAALSVLRLEEVASRLAASATGP